MALPGRLERTILAARRVLSTQRRVLSTLSRSAAARRRTATRAAALVTAAAVSLGVARVHRDAVELRDRWGPTTTVLVALDAAPAGSEIERVDVATVEVPRSIAPPSPLESVPEDTSLREALSVGEVLTEDHLPEGRSDGGYRGTLVVRLEPAIPPPRLAEGDRVEVVGSAVPGTRPATVTRDAVVLAAPDEDDPTLEVAVPRAEAAAVTEVALAGGVAVLRAPG